jgi:hypothetical protein
MKRVLLEAEEAEIRRMTGRLAGPAPELAGTHTARRATERS